MLLLFSIAISIYIVPYLVGRAGRYNEKGVSGSGTRISRFKHSFSVVYILIAYLLLNSGVNFIRFNNISANKQVFYRSTIIDH